MADRPSILKSRKGNVMKRRLINLFALLACTAVVFGCSSSEDSSSSSPETASASESVEVVHLFLRKMFMVDGW